MCSKNRHFTNKLLTSLLALFKVGMAATFLVAGLTGCEGVSLKSEDGGATVSTSSSTTTTTTAAASDSTTTYNLVFTTIPSTGYDGTNFSTQPVITVKDTSSTAITSSTGTISLAAYTNSTCTTAAGGTLTSSGTALSSGVATFSGVQYSAAATIYLKATSTNSAHTATCSTAITVSSDAAIVTSDTFVRSNSTTTMGSTDALNGGSALAWTAGTGTFGISSGKGYTAVSTGLNVATVSSTYKNASVALEISRAPTSSSEGVGIYFRSDGTDQNGWAFIATHDDSNSHYGVYKFTGGVMSNVGYYYPPSGVAVDDVIRVEFSGPNLTFKLNGTAIYKTVDTAFKTNTKHGVMTLSTADRFDDFLIENADNTSDILNSDSFVRADSAATLGDSDVSSGGTATTWTTTDGTWGIATNQAYVPSVTGMVGKATFSSSYSDGAVQAKFSAHPTANFKMIGVVFRYQDANNYWALTSIYTGGAARYRLYKFVAGDMIEYGNYPSPANDDVVRVEFTGSKIIVKINGTTRIVANDTTYMTKTTHGMMGNDGAGRLKYFLFENGLKDSTTVMSDSFDRTASSTSIGAADITSNGLYQAWSTGGGTWGIASNTGYISALSSTYATAVVTTNFLNGSAIGDKPHCTAEVKLPTIPTANSTIAGLVLRYQDASNYVRAVMDRSAGGSNTYKLVKMVAGVETTLSTSSGVTPADGDVLKAIISGKNASLLVNDAVVAQGEVGTANLNVKYGMITSSTTARFNDFKLYDCSTSSVLTSDQFTKADASNLAGTTDIASGGTNYVWWDAPWNGSSGLDNFGISSNKMYAPGGTTGTAIIATGKRNCSIEVKLATINSSNSFGIQFRGSPDGATAYYLYYTLQGGPAYSIMLDKRDGGISNVADLRIGGGGGAAISNGDILRVEFIGSALTAKINGTTLTVSSGTTTLDITTGTNHGVVFGNSTDRLDDFVIEECTD